MTSLDSQAGDKENDFEIVVQKALSVGGIEYCRGILDDDIREHEHTFAALMAQDPSSGAAPGGGGGGSSSLKEPQLSKKDKENYRRLLDALLIRVSLGGIEEKPATEASGILARISRSKSMQLPLTRHSLLSTEEMQESLAELADRVVILYTEGTVLASSRGKATSAKLKFEEILRLDYNNPLGHLGLATLDFLDRNYVEAFKKYKEVLETCLILKESTQENRSIKDSTTLRIVYIGMSLCCLHLKRKENAIEIAQRAIEEDHNESVISVFALLILLSISIADRKMNEVGALIQRLHELAPKNAEVKLRFADMLYFNGVLSKNMQDVGPLVLRVLSTLNECPPLIPSQEAYAQMVEGRTRLCLGDPAAAKELLQAALRGNPALRVCHTHLARAEHELGNTLSCYSHLCEAKKHSLGEKLVSQMLCSMMAQEGFHQKAMHIGAHLTTAIASGDPTSWALAAFSYRLYPNEMAAHLKQQIMLQEGLTGPYSADWRIQLNISILENDVFLVQEVLVQLLDQKEKLSSGYPHDGPPVQIDFKKWMSAGGDSNAPSFVRTTVDDILARLGNLTEIPDKLFPALFSYGQLMFNKWKKSCRGERANPMRAAASAEEENREAKHVARETFKQILSFRPEYEGTYVRLYELSESTEEKEMWLRLLAIAHPTSTLPSLYRAEALRREGKAKQAIEVLKSFQDPKCIPIALGIASLYFQAAQSKAANEEHLELALNRFAYVLKKDRGNALAAHGIACCVTLKGNLTEALDSFSRVYEFPSNDLDIQEDLNRHIFNVLVLSGSFLQAIRQLERFSTLQDEDRPPGVTCALAYCYAGNEQWNDALKVLRQAVEKHEEDTPTRFNLTLFLFASVAVVCQRERYLSEQRGKEERNKIREAIRHGLQVKKERLPTDDEPAQKFLNALFGCANTLADRIANKAQKGRRDERTSRIMEEEWRRVYEEKMREQEEERKRKEEAEKRAQEERDARARVQYEQGMRTYASVLQAQQQQQQEEWAAEDMLQEQQEGQQWYGDGDGGAAGAGATGGPEEIQLEGADQLLGDNYSGAASESHEGQDRRHSRHRHRRHRHRHRHGRNAEEQVGDNAAEEIDDDMYISLLEGTNPPQGDLQTSSLQVENSHQPSPSEQHQQVVSQRKRSREPSTTGATAPVGGEKFKNGRRENIDNEEEDDDLSAWGQNLQIVQQMQASHSTSSYQDQQQLQQQHQEIGGRRPDGEDDDLPTPQGVIGGDTAPFHTQSHDNA